MFRPAVTHLVVCLAVGAALAGCANIRAPKLLSPMTGAYTWHVTWEDTPRTTFHEGEVYVDFAANDGEVIIEAIEPVDLVGADFVGARIMSSQRQYGGFDFMFQDPVESGFMTQAFDLPYPLSEYPADTEMPLTAVMTFRVRDDVDFVSRGGVNVTYTVDGVRRTDFAGALRFTICIDVSESTCEELVADQKEVWGSV